MEDIESLLQFTSEEHAHFEKESNLFSIIKTIDFLVSFLRLTFLSGIRVYVRKGKRQRVRQRIQVALSSIHNVLTVDPRFPVRELYGQIQPQSLSVGQA